MWNLLFPNLSLTKLSLEARMGKGKGSEFSTAVFLKPGTILFEFSNLTTKQGLELATSLNKKFPGNLKLIKKSSQT